MIKKAGCILINIVNKEIALVCRNGEYSFPKGHLEINETIRECAIRETIEETGHSCHLVNNKEISINHYKDSKGNEIENYFYLAIDDGKTEKEIKEKEKEITVWKKYDEVEETLSYQNLKDFWNEIKFEVEKIIENG